MLVTDGELDDPASLTSLPAGSRVEVLARTPARDAAVVSLDAPRAVVAGDTLEARVAIRAGDLPLSHVTLALMAGSDVLASQLIDSLGAGIERTIVMHGRIEGAARSVAMLAVVTAPGDVEPRNDTLGIAVQVAPAAGAVLASTAPDFDARFLIAGAARRGRAARRARIFGWRREHGARMARSRR